MKLHIEFSANLFFAVAIVFFAGCSSESPKVEYVIPVGYRGFFKIYEDKESGIKPEHRYGRYTYQIDDSGILKTSDISPVRNWHSPLASFSDGKKLIKYPSADTPNGFLADDTIALFTLETYSTGETYFFVGTKSEYDNVRYKHEERVVGNRALANTQKQ